MVSSVSKQNPTVPNSPRASATDVLKKQPSQNLQVAASSQSVPSPEPKDPTDTLDEVKNHGAMATSTVGDLGSAESGASDVMGGGAKAVSAMRGRAEEVSTKTQEMEASLEDVRLHGSMHPQTTGELREAAGASAA
jgi:hypothetical protein